MNIKQSITSVLSKYVDFSGRACRSEFWYWQLSVVVVSLVLTMVDNAVFPQMVWSPLSNLFSLAVFLPALSVTSRRLHDTDRSAWWMLLWFVPVIGWIIVIIWTILEGTKGSNRFGDDPLAGGAAEATPPVA